MHDVYISGSGTFLPGKRVLFDDIPEYLGELTEASLKIQNWVRNMHPVMKEILDIDYLHYAFDPATGEYFEDNISMSVKAAKKALDSAGVPAGEIDLICYGSAHMDQMPTPSARIQEALGINFCEEYSIHANCTSAYKAFKIAFEMIKNGKNKNALVISSNIASSELRADYYNQKLLDKESLFLRWFLCDGAGALLLTSDRERSCGYRVHSAYTESLAGSKPSLMFNERPAYWMNPLKEYRLGLHHLKQKFRNALSTDIFQEPEGSVFIKGFKRMLKKEQIDPAGIKIFQINMPTRHIIDSIKEEAASLGIARDVFYTKLGELGYAGPPMALICLDSIIREETLPRGALVTSFVTEVSKFLQAGYTVEYCGR
ncbi:MAG: hypothetical protein A2096_17795 [Spirochaetes bacterium GWF1_41_5]|nr:MAG: hypothetical protein A2096_17795 [Spirochaetes bacterium GWF1_41_5]HBE02541.1 3-oxoacyl-ACP synthase [Spirochaetia bacterium]